VAPNADPFELLGLPRQPWFEPDTLKRRFLELAAPWHPDRHHQAPQGERDAAHTRYTELNAAYARLRGVRFRLRALATLENGAPPADVHAVPPAHATVIFEVTQLCHDVDAFLKGTSALAAPILRAQAAAAALGWVQPLKLAEQRLGAWRLDLDQRLQQLNPAWLAAPASPVGERRVRLPLAELVDLYRDFGFVERLSQQLQTRLAGLAAVSV
jgi:PAS domain-containing protein